MPRRRNFVTLLLTLGVLSILGPCEPAWAHSPLEPGAEVTSEIVPGPTGSNERSDGNDLPGWALAAAPALPGVPWLALAIVAAAVALGSWRPRRAAVLVLVLLIAVFAFEDGLHSVHHGMNPAKASTCPIAAAATHLNATPVDSVAPCDVVLPVVALAIETSPSDPIAHLASPEQGRAPPYSLV